MALNRRKRGTEGNFERGGHADPRERDEECRGWRVESELHEEKAPEERERDCLPRITRGEGYVGSW